MVPTTNIGPDYNILHHNNSFQAATIRILTISQQSCRCVGIIPGQHLPAWDESLTMVTIAGGDRYGGRRRRVLDEWCWVTEVSRSRDPISRLTFTSLMFTGHWTQDLDLDTALTIELITLRYLHFPVICDHIGKNSLGKHSWHWLTIINYCH